MAYSERCLHQHLDSIETVQLALGDQGVGKRRKVTEIPMPTMQLVEQMRQASPLRHRQLCSSFEHRIVAIYAGESRRALKDDRLPAFLSPALHPVFMTLT